ncbi:MULTISPECIES: hypothetical protein [Lactobacillus]|uniref:hypothetical protein n=1 Tax=Lactobacillus TaxID=1578 RepID=UPI001F383CC6|nr:MULTISPECIES: hypothetical protein [Lactobacillus]
MVDIEEWRSTQAKLLEQLQKGYQSLQNEKIVSRDEFRNSLGIANNRNFTSKFN